MSKDKNTEKSSESKDTKAWFEKDIDDWDENDEQEAYLNLFINPHPPQN